MELVFQGTLKSFSIPEAKIVRDTDGVEHVVNTIKMVVVASLNSNSAEKLPELSRIKDELINIELSPVQPMLPGLDK